MLVLKFILISAILYRFWIHFLNLPILKIKICLFIELIIILLIIDSRRNDYFLVFFNIIKVKLFFQRFLFILPRTSSEILG